MKGYRGFEPEKYEEHDFRITPKPQFQIYEEAKQQEKHEPIPPELYYSPKYPTHGGIQQQSTGYPQQYGRYPQQFGTYPQKSQQVGLHQPLFPLPDDDYYMRHGYDPRFNRPIDPYGRGAEQYGFQKQDTLRPGYDTLTSPGYKHNPAGFASTQSGFGSYPATTQRLEPRFDQDQYVPYEALNKKYTICIFSFIQGHAHILNFVLYCFRRTSIQECFSIRKRFSTRIIELSGKPRPSNESDRAKRIIIFRSHEINFTF